VCVWRAAFVLVSWNFQQVLLKYDITQAGCSRKKTKRKTRQKYLYGYLEMAPRSQSAWMGEQTPKVTLVARAPKNAYEVAFEGSGNFGHRKSADH